MKRLHGLIIFLSMVLLSSVEALGQRADDSVDLSSKFGPVRDQGASAFCHAFVAADLLDEAFGHKTWISALDLGLKAVRAETLQHVAPDYPQAYQEMRKPLSQRYSNVRISVHAFFGVLPSTTYQGICREEDLPSESPESPSPNFIEQALRSVALEDPIVGDIESVGDRLRGSCRRGEEPNFTSWLLPGFRSQDLSSITTVKSVQSFQRLLKRGRPFAVQLNLRQILLGGPVGPENHLAIVSGFYRQNGTVTFVLRHSFGADCRLPSGESILNCENGYQDVSANALAKAATAVYYFSRNLDQVKLSQSEDLSPEMTEYFRGR